MKKLPARSKHRAARCGAATLALVSALWGLAPQARAQPATNQAEAFSVAMDLYRDCHWSAAYGRFARLADTGHGESARIVLLMLQHGPRLYGTQWSASAAQIERWSAWGALTMPRINAEPGD